MSNTPYITLGQDNKQQLAALEPIVSDLVSAALPTELAAGVPSIKFTSQLSAAGAILRLGTGSPALLQYSTDNGTTWTNIESSNYIWRSGAAYVVNDIVQYSGAWYTCVAAASSEQPGTGGSWRIIGAGSAVYNVYNAAQLLAALQATGTFVEIVLHGVLTIPATTVTVQASTLVIRSDESCSVSGSLTLSATNKNVYWHSSGTVVPANLAITMQAGTMWIERMAVTGGTLTLTGLVKYQQISGSVSGGTQMTWTLPEQAGGYVPLDMSGMTGASYADAAYIYIYNGGNSGKLLLGDLLAQYAANAARQIQVDAVGSLSQRPAVAATGYLYYASDTGDLYRMGDANTWGPAIHIQGPQGAPGPAGITPTVTITPIAGGYRLTITGAQPVDILNGATPVFTDCLVTTLPPGSPATASLVRTPGTNTYTLSLGIPRGQDGTVEGVVQISRKQAMIFG